MITSEEIYKAKLLIVDDQEANVRLLDRALQQAGYAAPSSTTDPNRVCELHLQHHFDLILLDLVMPGRDGFQVMEDLKSIEEVGYLPVLVITAEPEHKIRALKAGARDFVSQPLDLPEVLTRVYNMLEVRLLHLKTRKLYQQVLEEQETQKVLEGQLQEALVKVEHDASEPLGVVAKSPAMEKLLDLVKRVAQVDSTVLITGESGSGKERIARMVHEGSSRAKGPFIAVNCGAIVETLLESELFGHAKGAFTGATADRPGIFEAANGGTLLLDEVGEVSSAMQVKLLRALQEREVRRVGENKTRSVDVRVLAATNRDLAQAVAAKTFREDLYYRLKVIDLRVPALRERRDDLVPLAQVLLADAALRLKRKISGLAPEVADQLIRYSWPGNVRELGNAMERAVALARGTRVELEDLPEEVRQAQPSMAKADLPLRPLAEVEKDYILHVLERCGGNQTIASVKLDIGDATLYRKLKGYGLTTTRNDKRKSGPTT